MIKSWAIRSTMVAVIMVAITAGIMVLFSNCWAAEKVITLQFSSFFPAMHKQSQLEMEWCKEIEKRTEGRVKISHFPAAVLTPAAQTYDSVMRGIADIGLTVPAYSRGRFPLTEVLDLPLGIKSARLGTKMYNEYFKKFKPREFDGVKMLYLFCHGPAILSTKTPVNNLEDLRGLKIRCLGTVTKIVSDLGASPVSMPQTETYDALRTGVAQGLLCPYESLQGWRFAEVAKYTVENYGSSYVAGFIVIMNKNKWDSLPKDIQKIFEKVSEEWIERSGALWDALDAEGKKYVQSKGNKITHLTPAEDKKWADRLVSMKKEYVDSMKAKGLPGEQALQFCTDYVKNNQK